MSAPNLRIAVADAFGWRELTADAAGAPIERITAATLGEASARTARADRPVFVDVEVILDESVPGALDAFDRRYPGVPDRIVHAGTPATLAGLLRDVWAAEVAHGVTLTTPDGAPLEASVLSHITAQLGARGLAPALALFG
ncbi:hypothetical protein [Gordonia sp. VNK21]|uniref:hypothetical protein n=1 Tax=Gordonia sp. VNK21 TaxID=3382483 RepID=UPI0038D35B8E